MMKNRSGFTLIELLTVITIMGLMAAMLVPAAGRFEDREKERITRENLQALRTAILGPENRFDAQGFPVLGGYVGDSGHLPWLYEYRWNGGAWNYDTTEFTANFIGIDMVNQAGVLLTGTAPDFTGDHFAQPSDLWRNREKYLSTPRDPFPPREGDWEWDPENDIAETRLFALHQSDGRLSDGWGRSLIIYSDSGLTSEGYPKNLVFVSAGRSGRYDPTDLLDTALSGNNDNIILRIEPHHWRQDARWRSIVSSLRTALGGYPQRDEPSGYLADSGRQDFEGVSLSSLLTYLSPLEKWEEMMSVSINGTNDTLFLLSMGGAQNESIPLSDFKGRVFFSATDFDSIRTVNLNRVDILSLTTPDTAIMTGHYRYTAYEGVDSIQAGIVRIFPKTRTVISKK